MPPTAPIKVGFVGLSRQGWAARGLAPALTSAELRDRYSLVALLTRSEESAIESAKKWTAETGHPVEGFHGDVSNLLEGASNGLDMVAVSLFPSLHKDVLLPAIRAGKDFFVEYSAGKTFDETKIIAAEEKKYGVRSLIGLQHRQMPSIRKAKEIIDSGKLGKILSSNMISLCPREGNFYSPTIRASLNEKIYEHGITLLSGLIAGQLDTVSHLLGNFASVSAIATTQFPDTTIVDDATGQPTEIIPSIGPDHIAITSVLDTGVLLTNVWRAGLKATTPGRLALLWDIDGEEGSLRLQATPGNIFGGIINAADSELYLNGEKVEVEGAGPGAQLQALKNNWAEFAKGDEGTHATIEDVVKIKRVVEAIEESIATGRRVDV